MTRLLGCRSRGGGAAPRDRAGAGDRDVLRPRVRRRPAHLRLLDRPREDGAGLRAGPAGTRTRAGEIVENLRREGFDLTLEDAIREAGAADSIGRPHIARAAGATGDLGPFFEEYLVPGAKAFVPRRWPTAEEAIELIRDAGGVAVIAHPYWDISDPDEVEDLIRSLPADGVETFYPSHTKEQTEHLSSSARSWTWSPPRARTTTARPTRPSPSSAPTTLTASASRRCRQAPPIPPKPPATRPCPSLPPPPARSPAPRSPTRPPEEPGRRHHVADEEDAVAAVDRRAIAPGGARQVERTGSPGHHLPPAPGLALAPLGERRSSNRSRRAAAASVSSPGRIGI